MSWRKTGSVALMVLGLLGGLLAGCDGEMARRRQEAFDTLTQRQRDSLLGSMPVPGAGGVGRAMKAADSLAARAERHDTIH